MKYTVCRGEKEVGRYSPQEMRRLLKSRQLMPEDSVTDGGGGRRGTVYHFLRQHRDDWRIKRAAIAAGVTLLLMVVGGVVLSRYEGNTAMTDAAYAAGLTFGVLAGLVLMRSRVAITLLLLFGALFVIKAMVSVVTEAGIITALSVVIFGALMCIYIDGAEAIFSHHKKKNAEITPGKSSLQGTQV